MMHPWLMLCIGYHNLYCIDLEMTRSVANRRLWMKPGKPIKQEKPGKAHEAGYLSYDAMMSINPVIVVSGICSTGHLLVMSMSVHCPCFCSPLGVYTVTF
jgi:hypothetical protein